MRVSLIQKTRAFNTSKKDIGWYSIGFWRDWNPCI